MIAIKILSGIEEDIAMLTEGQLIKLIDYGKLKTDEVFNVKTIDGQEIKSSQIDKWEIILQSERRKLKC
jgi:hypothetical protein